METEVVSKSELKKYSGRLTLGLIITIIATIFKIIVPKIIGDITN